MDDYAPKDRAPAIVALPSEIDMTNVSQVHDQLSAAVASGAPVVIADLSATDVCDAGGVRQLVLIRDEAAARGSQLRLVIPPGSLLRRVLVLLGVDHLLPVYSSVEDARGQPDIRGDPLRSCRPGSVTGGHPISTARQPARGRRRGGPR